MRMIGSLPANNVIFYPLEILFHREEFIAFNGSQGSNRQSQQKCVINATNDWQALQCFLANYQQQPHTYRLYQKEVERLVLWSIYHCQKSLSSLQNDDILAYDCFIQDPQPRQQWCRKSGGRGYKRGQGAWRPFSGPLSQASRATTFAVLKALFAYLTTAHYLAFNPFSLIKHLSKNNVSFYEEHKLHLQARIISIEEWNILLDTLEHSPRTCAAQQDEYERLRFIIYFLYFLGVRIQDLTSNGWDAFSCINNQWWFYVRGKGGKLGRIPVHHDLLNTIKRYRHYWHFSAELPDAQETLPLVINWYTGNALTARTINKLIKTWVTKSLVHFVDKPEVQARLKKFSAHWLRHLSATMQDLAGIPETHIQQNLRHSTIHTTRMYMHVFDDQRHASMQKLSLRGNKPIEEN